MSTTLAQEIIQENKMGTMPVGKLLANMALRKGCYYVNIREALTNTADGSQIDDYATKDGVHFNAAGYHAVR